MCVLSLFLGPVSKDDLSSFYFLFWRKGRDRVSVKEEKRKFLFLLKGGSFCPLGSFFNKREGSDRVRHKGSAAKMISK